MPEMSSMIERPAVQEFRPSFSELLASEYLELLRERLRRWIAVHGEESRARFVYVAWLLAARDVRPFVQAIGRWLARHVDEPDAHYVYVEWLRSGGSMDVVAGSLASWLDRHGLIEEACWPCVAWLQHGGKPDHVRNAVERWLSVWAEHPGASHVYEEWLSHGGEPALIGPAVQRWLCCHGDQWQRDGAGECRRAGREGFRRLRVHRAFGAGGNGSSSRPVARLVAFKRGAPRRELRVLRMVVRCARVGDRAWVRRGLEFARTLPPKR
ncbi:MAG: hypothetical protein ACRDK4_07535 [Solirubrobacteraceae bacterium]